MNKSSYSSIKDTAKLKMSGHFGEAFLALLLLPMAFAIGRSTISFFFTNAVIAGQIVDFFIVVLILYVTLNLALKFYKGEFSTLFVNLLGDRNVYLNLVIFTLISSAIFLFPIYIYTDSFTRMTYYFATIQVDSLTYEDFIDILIEYMPNTQLIYTSFVLVLIGIIIRVKLYLTPYLIVDKEMKAIDAIKLSWNYTSGNFLRIFFFPLSFILWFLLIFITCGLILIYLIPYMSIAQVSLYQTILRENGDISEIVEEKEISKPVDPLEEKESKDPFDDYYE